ncbi:hypothetical protein Tco_0994592 [Tanacetum coccineum]
MKRGFRGVPRPLLPVMLPVVVVDQSARPADQAEDQPSSSAPLPSSSLPPVISATITSKPKPVAEPTTHHTLPSYEPDNEQTKHIFEQPSPEHQPLSPRQETETKLAIGKAIVKLVKKVKKLEDLLKRRHVVLTNSKDEEPEDQERIIQNIDDDPLGSKGDFVTPTKPSGEAHEEEISPTTLEAAKTLSNSVKDISTGFEEVNTCGLGVSTGSGPGKSFRRRLCKKIGRVSKSEKKILCRERAKSKKKSCDTEKESRKRTSIELQTESSKKLKSDTKEDVSIPKEKDKESVNRKEEFKIKKPEDVEAYMEERVDEPSSEEFLMGSIPQGPAPAKIVKWQIIKTGKRGAYQIIREDNTYVVYVNFQGLLNDLTRDDLKELYRLMMLKYGDNRPEEEFERVLWGDLKTMFDPPSEEDAIWKLPHQQQILNWRYFHSCSVHCLTVEAAHIYMLTEVKYPLPPRVCKAMLEKKLLGDRKDESTMSNRHKDWLVQEQTALGKDFSNPFMADNLPKILDENWFTLDENLLREALEITPIDQAHSFVTPPSGDAIRDFVNELGYPQGIITSTDVDFAELMWEEFVQAIQTFLIDKANLGSPTKKGRKDKPHVIPFCRFTKLIICHLGRIHNIHQRSTSLFHLAEEDLRLGNLKFVPKGEEDC